VGMAGGATSDADGGGEETCGQGDGEVGDLRRTENLDRRVGFRSA